MLGDAGEDVLVVVEADTAGHAAVLAEGILQFKTYDAVLAFRLFMGAAPVGQNLEGFLSVEVVTVDDGEGFLDHVLGHEHGVRGAPGLHPVFGHGEGRGNLVQFLGNEGELQRLAVHGLHAGVFLLYMGFHVGLEEVTDDIDHLAETGFHGIVDGIVNDGFSVGAQTVHLFESAVTAAHAGSKNKKSRFHLISILWFCLLYIHANLLNSQHKAKRNSMADPSHKWDWLKRADHNYFLPFVIIVTTVVAL